MVAHDSVFDRLNEEHAPSLPRLQPGDRFSGRIVRIDLRTGTFSRYPVVTLELDRSEIAGFDGGGTVAWHVLHAVAQNELARLRVKPGEAIAACYRGLIESKTGTGKYHAWSVVADRPATEFGWHEFTDGDSEQPASDVPSDATGFAVATAGSGNDGDSDPIPF